MYLDQLKYCVMCVNDLIGMFMFVNVMSSLMGPIPVCVARLCVWWCSVVVLVF